MNFPPLNSLLFKTKVTSVKAKAPKAVAESLTYKDLEIVWVKKAYYRNINIKVYEDLEIRLTTGKKPPSSFIEEFLTKNYQWIKRSLASHQKTINEIKAKKILPKPYIGGWVPFLGHAFKIVQADRPNKVRLCQESKSIYLLPEEQKSVADQLSKLYKKEAANYMTKVQEGVSAKMGLAPKKLSFRNQKTRWGSCSSTGTISYNWRLMAAPGAWLEYVIVHETAHLKHMDHSANFWGLVSRFSPNYKAYVVGLKKQHLIFGFFSADSNLYYLKKNFTE